MGRSNSVALIGAACLFMAAVAGTAGAQQAALPPNDKPFQEKWGPSEFGPDDKVGAISRITPEYVLKVITLVKQGKTATLANTTTGTFRRSVRASGTWSSRAHRRAGHSAATGSSSTTNS